MVWQNIEFLLMSKTSFRDLLNESSLVKSSEELDIAYHECRGEMNPFYKQKMNEIINFHPVSWQTFCFSGPI